MANQKSELKKAAQDLKKYNGQVRGEVILNRLEFIRQREGEKAVSAVEKKLKEIGWPLDFSQVKPLSWYKEAYGILIILAAQEIFGWSKKDIFAMGEYAPKVSMLVKFLMKYFVLAEKTFQASPQNWRKHYSTGELEAVSFDSIKKKLVLRLKNYNPHPVMCVYLRGYFTGFGRLVLHAKEVKAEETKCVFKNDSYHEFIIKWQ